MLLLLVNIFSFAQEHVRSDSERRKIAFVQGFYDWYLRQSPGNSDVWPLDTAIKNRPELFDAPLLRALQIDAYARAHANGEIDGLDWDPFLNGQDYPDHYEATNVVGNSITIIGYDHQPSQPSVSLQAEVRCTPDHCVFVNFHYPAKADLGRSDLLKTLKLLHPTNEAKK